MASTKYPRRRSLSLTQQLWEALRTVAQTDGQSISTVVRLACAEYCQARIEAAKQAYPIGWQHSFPSTGGRLKATATNAVPAGYWGTEADELGPEQGAGNA